MNEMTDEKIKDRISILTQLANVDGDFDVRELAFIYNVSIRNNLEVDSIADIINTPHPVISFTELSDSEKVDYMADILFLMMIDGRILPKEIEFSLVIGYKLGFCKNDIQELITQLQYQDVNEVHLKKRIQLLLKV